VTPHPLTVASIEQFTHAEANNGWWSVPCGCSYKRTLDAATSRVTKWRLCQYHQGYDDGVNASDDGWLGIIQ
jgi:hypothetical protein